MQKPILVAIDDDSNRLEAVVEELRRHYDPGYHIAGATSSDAALELCRQWNERESSADDGLSARDGDEEVRVIGRRWAAADHAVRDFLTRNRVEYQWLNMEQSAEAVELLRARGLDDAGLPVVLFGDGTTLVQPSLQELAAKVGLRTEPLRDLYDLIVVGAGPAGLGAAVYAASEGLTTLVVEPDAVGGQAGSSSCIENYLGFPHGVSGDELARRSYVQASRLGAEFLTQRVVGIGVGTGLEDGIHRVRTGDGRELRCRVCLIATGVEYCRLELSEAEQFVGAGVYYGATRAEARACSNEEIYLVGGANSAGQSALHFARYAARVHMLVRGDGLAASMSQYLIDQIVATPNIVVESETEVIALAGKGHLEELTLRTPRGDERRKATSLFIFIGAVAKTEWLPEEIAVDEEGFVLAGPDLKRVNGNRQATSDELGEELVADDLCARANAWTKSGERAKAAWRLEREPFLLETSVPGIFVAGDVRAQSVKRCAAAAGEGSIAVSFMHQYLATL